MDFYAAVGLLLRTALGFWFRRFECFRVENAPRKGPVLFTSNHPNSLADSFVIGAAVPRKVHFVATVELFRRRPIAWLLRRAGVIPINRVKDDPRAMRDVFSTFAEVFKVLEGGGAVAIFPEGITHDAPRLEEVKSGAARIALELESRHAGKLGLTIVPLGLNYAAKDRYRSEILVNFGEPIAVAGFLQDYSENRKVCIRRLTQAVERGLQDLILHIPELDRAHVVDGVARLYLDRLKLANVVIQEPLPRQAEELALKRAISDAVDFAFAQRAEQARSFAAGLSRYERWLERLKLSDAAVRAFAGEGRGKARSALWALAAVAGAPVALYGWLHRLLPILIVRWAVARFADTRKHKAQVGTTALLAAIPAFGGFYGALVALVYLRFGLAACVPYALSLPVAGVVAHYYLGHAGVLWAALRAATLGPRLRFAAPLLVRQRGQLLVEIEALRADYRRHKGLG